jgi:hypothetical protein
MRALADRQQDRSCASGSRAGKLPSARTLPPARRLSGSAIDSYPRNWASAISRRFDHAWTKSTRTSRDGQLPASPGVGTLTRRLMIDPAGTPLPRSKQSVSLSCRGRLPSIRHIGTRAGSRVARGGCPQAAQREYRWIFERASTCGPPRREWEQDVTGRSARRDPPRRPTFDENSAHPWSANCFLDTVAVPGLVARVVFFRRYRLDLDWRLRRIARQQPEGGPMRRMGSLLVGVGVHDRSKMKKGHHRFQVMALGVSRIAVFWLHHPLNVGIGMPTPIRRRQISRETPEATTDTIGRTVRRAVWFGVMRFQATRKSLKFEV